MRRRRKFQSGKYPDWLLHAIVKAGGHAGKDPYRLQSESNKRIAKRSLVRATHKAEIAKARATIRGLLASKMIGKARK